MEKEKDMEDEPMSMVDIPLPFDNHTHVVTWLNPKQWRPLTAQNDQKKEQNHHKMEAVALIHNLTRNFDER